MTITLLPVARVRLATMSRAHGNEFWKPRLGRLAGITASGVPNLVFIIALVTDVSDASSPTVPTPYICKYILCIRSGLSIYIYIYIYQ